MAHFAKVKDGIVTKVIVAEDDFFNTFIDNTPGEWVQCSFNTHGNVHSLGGTPLRKNFPSEGFVYDGVGFHPAKPYPSYTFNDTTYLWEAPIALPDDGKMYKWNETAYQADNSTGWDLDE